MAITLQRASDLKYVDINEGFTKITGYSREEALEHTIKELNLYPDKEISAQMSKLFREQGFLRDFEIPFRRKSGEIGYGLVWGEPIKINGEAMYIAGTIDITERKKSEILQSEQTQEIKTLYRALSEIAGKPDNVETLTKRIAEIVANDFHAYKSTVWLLSDDHSQVVRKAYSGMETSEHEDVIPMNVTSLITTAIKTRESIYTPDIRTDPRYFSGDESTLSEFVVPLQAYGEVIGVINMESPKVDDFSEGTRRLVSAFAQNATLALQNTNLLDSLEKNLLNLKESQSRINFFLEHTAEGVYRIDYDPPIPIHLPIEEQFRLSVEHGKIAECNVAFANMYGLSTREEMIGKPYIEFYGKEGYESNMEGNLEFMRQGYKIDDFETEEFNIKGEKVYFANNVVGIIRDGYFVSTWGTQRDITTLKKALTELEKLNQELEKKLTELKESQARINFFLEHTAEGVYRVDYDPPIPVNLPFEEQYKLSRERGKFGECNLAIAKMYGYSSREEMLEAPYYLENKGYEASLKANLEFYRQGYKTDDYETEEYTPNGEKAYFLNNAVGIIRDGYFLSIWGTQRDITPLKKAIAELEKRNAELERFTYTLWHELKSPLVTIRGFLGYLENSIKSQKWDRVQSDLSRISQAADKMNLMIVNLLDVLRAGHVLNISEPVTFHEIIQKAIEPLRKNMNEEQIRLEIESEFPLVHGDRERLTEVVEALVENAIKYMGDQPDPQINIGLRTKGDEQIFFVSDNGMGIDPEYHERVFNIFEKLNPQSEGTGIGLALVRRIIETHGGRIWVESEGLGKGTTFCFTLPTTKL
jgi:PAS domain S-box-containing protein